MPRSTTLTAAALTALAACAFAAPAASQVTTAGGEVVSTAQKHLDRQSDHHRLDPGRDGEARGDEDGEPLRERIRQHARRRPCRTRRRTAKGLRQEGRRARGRSRQPARDGVRQAILGARVDAGGPRIRSRLPENRRRESSGRDFDDQRWKGRRERRRLEEGSQPERSADFRAISRRRTSWRRRSTSLARRSRRCKPKVHSRSRL